MCPQVQLQSKERLRTAAAGAAVFLVDEPMAAALGAGLPVTNHLARWLLIGGVQQR